MIPAIAASDQPNGVLPDQSTLMMMAGAIGRHHARHARIGFARVVKRRRFVFAIAICVSSKAGIWSYNQKRWL
jgi:hypothetical protein